MYHNFNVIILDSRKISANNIVLSLFGTIYSTAQRFFSYDIGENEI